MGDPSGSKDIKRSMVARKERRERRKGRTVPRNS